MGVDPSPPETDACAHDICTEKCDKCEEVCNPDDKDNGDEQKCKACIEENDCEECFKCVMERKFKNEEGGEPSSDGLIDADPPPAETDACAHDICTEKCDKCEEVCNPDDKDNGDEQKCKACIEENDCEECFKCVMERKFKSEEGGEPPSDGLIDADPSPAEIDSCAEDGVCADQCDECRKVCNPDDKENGDEQTCKACIEKNEEFKCEECMKCEMERKFKEMEEGGEE